MRIIWRGLEIYCNNYEIIDGYIQFEFANIVLIVPENEIEVI